jgi:membrane associated rhomboid family serine protease
MMPIRLSYSVKILIAGLFAVFIVQQTGDQFFGTHLLGLLGLNSVNFFHHKAFWQLFTYSWVHVDVTHLFLNLLMLALIGTELELAWGSFQFLKYYFFCSFASGVVFLLMHRLVLGGSGADSMLIGASGALYGLLTAYGLIFGERVLLFMMLFPMKAKHFVWVLALVQLMTTVYSPGGGWASLAHLAGMAAGLVYLWVRVRLILAQKNTPLLSRSKRFLTPRKRAHYLKLVVNKRSDLDQLDTSSEDHPKTWH